VNDTFLCESCKQYRPASDRRVCAETKADVCVSCVPDKYAKLREIPTCDWFVETEPDGEHSWLYVVDMGSARLYLNSPMGMSPRDAENAALMKNALPALLADLDAATRERDELKSNVENAVRCAKGYCPNYPWTLNTASEAVWATGESYKGVSAACDDLHKDLDAATADLKSVSAALDGLAEHNVKLRTENAKLREALEDYKNQILARQGLDDMARNFMGEAQAWAVNCPPSDEFDVRVFSEQDSAEIQAELFNDDLPEGETRYFAVPLYSTDSIAKIAAIARTTLGGNQ
jgi:hypothetical protein